MFEYIYFDLDNTLVRDNPNTGKSEILKSGYEQYVNLKKTYPRVPFILFSERNRNDISYPNVFVFDEVVGKDNMDIYIVEHMQKVPIVKYLYPKNLYIYLTGLSLFRRNETPKVLYIFLKHIIRNEKVMVIDDDRRVFLTFKW